MAGTSQSGSTAAPPSLAEFRDAEGYLPLVHCTKCGTRLVGRVSRQDRSYGKRFYKCPLLEHTPKACKSYYFEEDYVEFLVSEGKLPQCFSKVTVRASKTSAEVKESMELLKEAMAGVVEVSEGKLPQCFSKVHTVRASKTSAEVKESMELLKEAMAGVVEAMAGVERCSAILHSATIAMQG